MHWVWAGSALQFVVPDLGRQPNQRSSKWHSCKLSRHKQRYVTCRVQFEASRKKAHRLGSTPGMIVWNCLISTSWSVVPSFWNIIKRSAVSSFMECKHKRDISFFSREGQHATGVIITWRECTESHFSAQFSCKNIQ